MTDFGDLYLQIMDVIVSKLNNLEKDGKKLFKTVITGWKTPVTSLPAAFVLPDPSIVTPATTKKDKHTLRYIIAVVKEQADVQQGLRDVISTIGAVYSELVKDRTLGGKCDNLEATRFEYHWRRAPAFVRHWCAMFLDVYLFYV